MQDVIDLYQKYHSGRKLQKRIVSSYNFTYRNLIEILDRFLIPRFNVLDVGCSVGTIDFYLASKGLKVIGIDISKTAISIAKRNAELFGFNNQIAYYVKVFPNQTVSKKFDIVVCTEVIEHLYKDKKAVQKIYELLKNRGILILSTPSENAPLYKVGFLKKHDSKVGHLRRYTDQKLVKIISQVGFEVIETRKTEGILKNFLFTYPRFGNQIVRLANRFKLFSDVLTFVDNIFLEIFGESQVYIVAQK